MLQEFAGIQGLADRVSDISLVDSSGDRVAFKKFQAGEFEAEQDFGAFEYAVDLTPQKSPASAGHISWLNGRGGILFLHDLLPQLPGRIGHVGANIRLTEPTGWKAVGGREAEQGTFRFPQVENGVIFVGPDIRLTEGSAGEARMLIAVNGNWNFADDDIERIAGEIFDENLKVFGDAASNEACIFLARFPNTVPPGNWEGDTRGNTVTIVSSDMSKIIASR